MMASRPRHRASGFSAKTSIAPVIRSGADKTTHFSEAEIAHPTEACGRCTFCGDSGWIWVGSRDLGATKIPCECQGGTKPVYGDSTFGRLCSACIGLAFLLGLFTAILREFAG
jgi:hypothetical protein